MVPSAPTEKRSVSQGAPSWPRSAQLAMAFLLGAATTLLLAQWTRTTQWGTRPADLERGLTYRVDINHASHAQLLQLPGVGEGMAERIESQRDSGGPFASPDDLRRVRRVGEATVRRLEPWISTKRQEADGAAGRLGDLQQRTTRPVGGKKAAALKHAVDINRAGIADLLCVPWIGPATARRIVEERQKRPFRSVDDLRRVTGIGVKKLESIRPYVTVDGERLRLAAREDSDNHQ